MLLVVFGMSVITFALTHVVPGNPARLLAGPHARQAEVDALAARYHMNGSVFEQYAVYMGGLLHGDLGLSITTRRPVVDDLRQYLPATLELTIAALALTIAIGLPLGMLSAVRHGRPVDHLSRVFAIVGVSMPVFWLGLVLQVFFYKKLSLLPVGGRLDALDISPPT